MVEKLKQKQTSAKVVDFELLEALLALEELNADLIPIKRFQNVLICLLYTSPSPRDS